MDNIIQKQLALIKKQTLRFNHDTWEILVCIDLPCVMFMNYCIH